MSTVVNLTSRPVELSNGRLLPPPRADSDDHTATGVEITDRETALAEAGHVAIVDDQKGRKPDSKGGGDR